MGQLLKLPVDQERVWVSLDGGQLVYFLNVPAFHLHVVFRQFVWAGIRTRPQPKTTVAIPQSTLHHLPCEQFSRATSFTPMSTSKYKWVESDPSFLQEILDLMHQAQQDSHLCLPVYNIDITSPILVFRNTSVLQSWHGPESPLPHLIFSYFWSRTLGPSSVETRKMRDAPHICPGRLSIHSYCYRSATRPLLPNC